MIRFSVIIIVLALSSCTAEQQPTAPKSSPKPKVVTPKAVQAKPKPTEWPFVPYDEVRAYVYNCLTHGVGNIIHEKGELGKEVANPNGLKLTQNQFKELSRILNLEYDNNHIQFVGAMCYNPHHGYVFFDSIGKVVAHVSMCLRCSRIHFEGGGENRFDSRSWKLLSQFTKNIGLPVQDELYEDYYYRFHPRPFKAKKDTVNSAMEDSL